MAFTGLVFGVIAAAWLLYLVPLFLNRRDNGLLEEVEPGQPFTPSVTIVRKSVQLGSAEAAAASVSTPFNRSAALYELSRIDADAARRRRLVLLFLLVVITLSGGAAIPGWVPWWQFLIPTGMAAVFLLIARFSVRAMRRQLDARAAAIRLWACADEDTVSISAPQSTAETGSIELTAPVNVTASLWDPVPITAPTYVSKPLAPRTVRTIDLSSPVSPARVPVTADAPETDGAGEGDLARAVGE